MKTILLLLACIAAANATSYTYEYWCAHNFVVYPTTCSYHYCVYFPDTWCSCAYYEPILKVYPGDDCLPHWHCWSETPVSTLVDEVRSLLAAELSKMCSQMYAHRNEFMATIDSLHAQFKADFERYISRWYSYRYECNGVVYVGDYVVERDGRIQEYCAQLDEIRQNVYNSYTEAIVAKADALTKYHAMIVERAEKALTTRLEKLAQYETQLCAKIDQYVEKFLQYHLALAQKNTDGYRKLWETLLCSDYWWTQFKANDMANLYFNQQCNLIYTLRDQYRSQISAYKSDLISYYTCNYRVAFGNSCLTFNQKCYYDQCKKLGCWYAYKSDYKCVAFKLAAFKYDLKLPTYKCLKKCDVDAVVGSVDGVVADLRAKMEAALAERQTQYDNWRSTWVGYHIQYKMAFAEIVMIRHNWYCMFMEKQYTDCHGVISYYDQARIAELKDQLLQQASEACANYFAQLIANLNAADDAHAKAQAQFREGVEKLISQIEESFNTCKSKRVVAIETYETKLREKVAAQREKLVEKLMDAKIKHHKKFVEMLYFYHGSNAHEYWLVRAANSCYIDYFLLERCEAMVHEYDCFWQVKIPELIQHFSCGYSCKIETKCLPTYHCGSYYEWHFCLPEPSAYCFQYDLWLQYYCA